MVVAVAKKISHPVFANPQHLGILLRHPSRTRPAGRCQDHALPRRMQTVEHLVQPAKLKPPLPRLQRAPGENADRHDIRMRQRHQPVVLGEDFGISQPLVGIVIGPVQEALG